MLPTFSCQERYFFLLWSSSKAWRNLLLQGCLSPLTYGEGSKEGEGERKRGNCKHKGNKQTKQKKRTSLGQDQQGKGQGAPNIFLICSPFLQKFCLEVTDNLSPPLLRHSTAYDLPQETLLAESWWQASE